MPYVGKLPTGVEVNEVYKQFEQGALMKTNNEFDLALEGSGFFTVLTERGEMYTRNGAFTINEDGILMTHNGNPVLGENGLVRIQQNNFMIREDGQIVVNLDEYGNEIYHKGVDYWFYNSLGLFAIAFMTYLIPSSSKIKKGFYFVLGGTLIFSVSLYALALTHIKILGAITPIGGAAMIIGWILCVVGIIKDSK